MKSSLACPEHNRILIGKKYCVECKEKTETFLEESNAIESVWDEKSLKQAKKAWDYLIKQPELTISDILHTHGILMKGKLDPDQTGAFRKCAVWIGGHEAKPWFTIPELVAQWVEQANEGLKLKDGLDYFITGMHVKFESIHPFIDGNGRIGRILLNWQRVKVGLPILIIYNNTKFEDYYPWFQ